MTSPLREALDDLVTDVPAIVVRDNLGARAWAAGRRRRVRRWAASTTLALTVLGVLTTLIVPLVRDQRSQLADGRNTGAVVGGHPQRIGHQWWTQDLPDRPGPIAAVAQIVNHRSTAEATWDELDGWHAVADDGHRWRLPLARDMAQDVHPTVSPDGRVISYLAGNAGPYVLHDLVAGRRIEFSQIGSGLMPVRTPYWAETQTPSFWSPDRARLLIDAGRRGPPVDFTGLVLGVDGSLRPVTPRGWTAGWIDDTTVAWLDWPLDGKPSEAAGAKLQVHLTDLDGKVRRSITLRPTEPWQADSFSQWTGRVSPDGKQILVLDTGFGSDLVRRFSLADGRETPAPVRVDGLNEPCGAEWAGNAPVVPVYDEETGVPAVAVRGRESEPVVVTKPRLGVDCMTWASDALAAGPRWTPFGKSTWWWTWWWREIAVAFLVLVAGAWIARRWRRRLPRPGVRRPRPEDPAAVDWWA